MPASQGRLIKSPYVHEPKPAKDSWHLVFDDNEYDRDAQKKIYIDSTDDTALTLAQMRLMTQQLGYGLRHRAGLKEGDVVAIFCTNSIFYPPAMFATQAASLICTFANPTYTEEELEYLARDSNAKLIITDSALMHIVNPVMKRMGLSNDKVYLLNPTDTYGQLSSIWKLRGEESIEPKTLSQEECKKTTAFRCYSSGTTGKAKGVETTHYNIGSVLQQYLDTAGERVTDDKIYLCFLPLYHIYGLFVFEYLGLYCGLQTVLMRKFEFADFLRCIQKYKVTNLTLVPPVVLALAKSPLVDEYDLSSVKEIGSAPLCPELYEQMRSRFGIPVTGGYGMTETTCIICTDKPETAREGSCGKLIAGVEGLLLDTGELLVRGPNITFGYWANEQANKDSWTEDGWMKTGDICTVDEDGYLYVTDRVKELIKYKGLQVAPAELEGVLLGRPDVLDVGVVPIYKADEATEVPRAYISLNDKSQASDAKAAEIVAWMGKKLAPYKQLRGGVVFIEDIPKNPSGKILRRLLRDRKGDQPLGLSALTRSAKL